MESHTRKRSRSETFEIGETSSKAARDAEKTSLDPQSSDEDEISSDSETDVEESNSNSRNRPMDTSTDNETDAEETDSNAESDAGEQGESSSHAKSGPPAEDYDVFLSFRGPDVRDDFIHYLYGDLIHANIRTFKDDDEIRKGEEIGESLFKAIKYSKVFVPILSKGYASSKWCLKELTCKVLDCNQGKQAILPVFYDVSPGDVKHQTGTYEEAFRQHQNNKDISKDDVQKWRDVLNKVGNLKGLVLETDAEGEKVKLKNLIIETLRNMLKEPFVMVPDALVGIDHQVEAITKLLDLEAKDVKIVGLCGMGGIGKTTIAKFIYNKLCQEFEACSFLADVRESSHKQGLLFLQKKLIDDICKQKIPDTSAIDDNIQLMCKRFADKKIIVVLDDVGDKEQVKNLVGKIECYGIGSRVIITTRDKENLSNLKFCETREVETLDLENSLKLFGKHAYKQDQPPKNKKGKLARDIVATTEGLPLALEVIGSLLYGRKIDKWRGTLEHLKESPNKRIQDTLMISYNDLDGRQREMFLDIACLFIGHDKDHVFPMWKACNFLPTSNFLALTNRCLVKTDKYNKIRMHDQLRDFGRDLVCSENFTDPGSRSRVWKSEDVRDIVRGKKGTNKIQAITNAYLFKYPSDLELTNEVFANTSNLRYLEIQDANICGDFSGLFSRLIWLKLNWCKFNDTLMNFCPEKLVVLELEGCDITENWNGWRILEMGVNLKILVVERCDNMKRSPKFSKNKGIERLSLRDCRSLVEIDASIESLQQLVFLDLSGCESLKELPEQLCSLKKLKTLWAERTNIKILPKSFGRKWSKFESFETTPNFRDSGIVFGRKWAKFESFEICPFPSVLPQQKFSIRCPSSLRKLPQSFGSLVSLSKLELRWCTYLNKLPKSIGELNKLKELIISDCPLTKLPNSIGNLKSLIVLKIQRTAISKLPNSVGNLRNLKEMYISCNPFLEGLLSGIWNLEKLEAFDMHECKKLELSIPDDIGKLVNLRSMNLRCTRIHSISGSISSLCSLQELNLIGANLLESLPDLPTSLQTLKASSMSSVVSKLTNLKTLSYVYGSDTRGVDVITLPPGLRELNIIFWKNIKSLPPISSSTLVELNVQYCYSLESLGDLSDLTNLSVLGVVCCHKIMEIQGLSRLASLKVLSVRSCSGLVTIDGLEQLDLLETLDISGCKSIEHLPYISHLKNLRAIYTRNSRFEQSVLRLSLENFNSSRILFSKSDCTNISSKYSSLGGRLKIV